MPLSRRLHPFASPSVMRIFIARLHKPHSQVTTSTSYQLKMNKGVDSWEWMDGRGGAIVTSTSTSGTDVRSVICQRARMASFCQHSQTNINILYRVCVLLCRGIEAGEQQSFRNMWHADILSNADAAVNGLMQTSTHSHTHIASPGVLLVPAFVFTAVYREA